MNKAKPSSRRDVAVLLRRLSEELQNGAEVENATSDRLLEAAAALLDDYQGREGVLGQPVPTWEFVASLLESALHYE